VVTTVYTDGACLGNPGPGGWAWAVPDGPFASGAAAHSTNQRMEITAALEAIRAIDGPLVVVSDSTYVVRCHTDRWYDAWEAKGWLNAQRKPVANRDLWEPMVSLFRERGDALTFRWIKGHSGDRMNDVVDRLAVEAATTQHGRRGDETPSALGAADTPARTTSDRGAGAPASRTKVPAGHRIVVFGHRPPELGGYADIPVATGVRRRLHEILDGLRVVHPDAVVLTGLGLGAEQLGAYAAIDAGVPYVAVLPFPGSDAKWPAASRAAFSELVAGAQDVITLSDTTPTSKQGAGIAIGKRNDWLIRNANGALVVYDGKSDRSVGTTLRALERRIPDDVWIVAPGT
jgi:ribonuclease HI